MWIDTREVEISQDGQNRLTFDFKKSKFYFDLNGPNNYIALGLKLVESPTFCWIIPLTLSVGQVFT